MLPIPPREFDFNPDLFEKPESESFRSVLKCLVGVAGEGDLQTSGPLLSSLACELSFNDARDSEKRNSKRQTATGPQIQAVMHKSVVNRLRNMDGARSISLEDHEWAQPLQGKP